MLKLTAALMFFFLVCQMLRKYDPRWIVKFSRVTLIVTPILIGMHFYAPSIDWASIELPKVVQSAKVISVDALPTTSALVDHSFWDSLSLGFILFAVWVIGSVVMLARELTGLFGLYGSRLDAGAVSANLQQSWQKILSEFGLKPIELRLMQQVQSPFITFSKGRAQVVVPACMDTQDLEPVIHALRHEAAHLRSKDHVWIPLMRLILCLLWFHPLVWCLALSHHHACEEACDAEAARVGGVQEYRKALAKIALSILPIKQSSVTTFIRIPSVTGRLKRVNETAPFRPPGILGLVPVVVLLVFTMAGLGMLQLEAGSEEKMIAESKLSSDLEKKTADVGRYNIKGLEFDAMQVVGSNSGNQGQAIQLSDEQKKLIIGMVSKSNIVAMNNGKQKSDISEEQLAEIKKAMLKSLKQNSIVR